VKVARTFSSCIEGRAQISDRYYKQRNRIELTTVRIMTLKNAQMLVNRNPGTNVTNSRTKSGAYKYDESTDNSCNYLDCLPANSPIESPDPPCKVELYEYSS
jgi:hypothetical protein